MKIWQLSIDTGGTFTDCIATATAPQGEQRRVKVLSSSKLRGTLLEKIAPHQFRFQHNWRISTDIFSGYEFTILDEKQLVTIVQHIDFEQHVLTLQEDFSLEKATDFELTAHEEAPILAARLITETPLHQPLPPLEMRLGSTKGTNALLEQKGADVTFLVTKGFADLIPIGTQQRPHLFQLDIPQPILLYQHVLEVEERLDASGNVLLPLSEKEIQRLVKQIQQQQATVVAIALLHSYRNPVHELQLQQALQEAHIPFISLSHQLSPTIKILPRATTALVNAYLAPILHTYLNNIQLKLGSAALSVMTSAGGLVNAQQFQPKDSLLSGPAGGVVGAAKVAGLLGIQKILTLDMGGTSTDTARYDGNFDYEFITKVGHATMLSPTLSIETVAAGGGSICGFADNRLFVGPESAGAHPGPACYGAGGALAITDVNLLLGKLEPSAMGIPVRAERALAALRQIQEEVEKATGVKVTELELLRGFEKIANEKMSEAIRHISVAKGFDPKEYALLVFGGAGGLHACRIAELLHISTIILPYNGGLLSAYGISQASVERFVERQILRKLDDCKIELASWIEQLRTEARVRLQKEGFDNQSISIKNTLIYLRFVGQDSTLEIEFQPNIEKAFEEKYRHLFGHFAENRAIEVESIKVIAASQIAEQWPTVANVEKYRPTPVSHLQPLFEPEQRIAVFDWEQLKEGAEITGPAILLNPTSTAFIEKNWILQLSTERNAILNRTQPQEQETEQLQKAIELELFINRFTAIAEEMGAQLQRTSFSINIKERLDFSCALLDANAELLVNAPHIPVHLGSLGICARLILEKFPLERGDVIITNHPKYGGSHLPDVTLLSAVFSAKNELIGYVINRAHHAEIGGKRPGSMPPDATTLAEEGVVILPTYLVKKGEVNWKILEDLLTTAPYPTRALAENLADVNAALASLRIGEEKLRWLVQQHGLEKVQKYMTALKNTAQQALQQALVPLQQQCFHAEERLDDGHLIKIAIKITDVTIQLDFSGTSSVHPQNLNANKAIVFSAILYVLRLLCKKEIPLNEGLMQHVELTLPESFLNPTFSDDPNQCPAVVGGNTEVSQRLVDTLIKAFHLSACSQGTMNNFLFGNPHFGYYETIGGGCGAGEGFHGRSAIHQHMTNTKITDPEELERRYPVRLQEFSIRKDSGGSGKWRGGDGIIREVEFLAPVAMTLISQHRTNPPFGKAGGQAGKVGKQVLIRTDGTIKALQGIDSQEIQAGERIRIETPGGGGWGSD